MKQQLPKMADILQLFKEHASVQYARPANTIPLIL